MSDAELLARMGTDAAVWAREYAARFGGDEGTLIGWFANAIEAGRADAVKDDRRPHSRACGWRPHPHGTECHTNCPTCGGRDVPAANSCALCGHAPHASSPCSVCGCWA